MINVLVTDFRYHLYPPKNFLGAKKIESKTNALFSKNFLSAFQRRLKTYDDFQNFE